jgi:hypothetical protein
MLFIILVYMTMFPSPVLSIIIVVVALVRIISPSISMKVLLVIIRATFLHQSATISFVFRTRVNLLVIRFLVPPIVKL